VKVTVVADASPIIYFARLDGLDFLSQVIGPVGIPPTVYRETVEAGRIRGYQDAERIADSIKNGALIRLELDQTEDQLAQNLQRDPRLGPGECETIACAIQRNLRAILHDKRARWKAAEEGVQTIHVVDILYLALLNNQLPLAGFKTLLRDLARITGMDPATVFEQEALAEEIALRLGLN
jgi:predicted nucleic acid-binding protein